MADPLLSAFFANQTIISPTTTLLATLAYHAVDGDSLRECP